MGNYNENVMTTAESATDPSAGDERAGLAAGALEGARHPRFQPERRHVPLARAGGRARPPRGLGRVGLPLLRALAFLAVDERAFLTYDWDEDGSLVVRGRLVPEDGALFLRALEAGRDAAWEPRQLELLHECGSAEPPIELEGDDAEADQLSGRAVPTAEPPASWSLSATSKPCPAMADLFGGQAARSCGLTIQPAG